MCDTSDAAPVVPNRETALSPAGCTLPHIAQQAVNLYFCKDILLNNIRCVHWNT